MKQGIIQEDFPSPEDLQMAYSFPLEVIIIFGQHFLNTGVTGERILCRCIIDGCLDAFQTQLFVRESDHIFSVSEGACGVLPTAPCKAQIWIILGSNLKQCM